MAFICSFLNKVVVFLFLCEYLVACVKTSSKCSSLKKSVLMMSVLNLAANIDSGNVIGKEARDTAELLMFFDKLFDSVNGNVKNPIHGKNLRCGINDSSAHIKFWTEEALPILNSMEFVVNNTKDRAKPPTLKNWIFTIKNFINVWNYLKNRGFDYLLRRHVNQDPLENLFGRIRSYGAVNTNPTASNFMTIYKTVLVNNTINLHQSSFNCEEDDCDILFGGVKFLVKKHIRPVDNMNENETGLDQLLSVETTSSMNFTLEQQSLQMTLSELATNYVTGFILKKN